MTGARPGSAVCVAGFVEGFRRYEVGSDGTFTISTGSAVAGLGGRREAIYQAADGIWVWRIEWVAHGTPESGLNAFQAWLWEPWQLTLAAILGAVVAVAVLVELAVRKALHVVVAGRGGR